MKLLLDYFPISVFVAVYFLSGADKPLYPAVVGLMVASLIQTVGSRIHSGKFEKLHLWMLAITWVAGGMTLVFRNPAFIQWKASIVVWVFAAVIAFRQWVAEKRLVEEIFMKVIDSKMGVPDHLWNRINLIWMFSYFVFGFLNLYIAFNYSEAFWVKFKLFGLLGLNLVLMIYSIFVLFPYLPEDENNGQTDSSQPVESADTKQINGENH